MSTKLTLTVDQQVIKNAKEYAQLNGRSLSHIVEEYLKSLSSSISSNRKAKYSKLVKELKGSVNDLECSKSYKELKKAALIKKHLDN